MPSGDIQRHRMNAHKLTNSGLQNRRLQVRFLSHLPLNSGFVHDTQSRFFVSAPVSAPLSSKDTTEKPFHGVPRWLAHLGLYMTVGLESERYGGVTKHLTHYEWLDTFQEQQGRRSVSIIGMYCCLQKLVCE